MSTQRGNTERRNRPQKYKNRTAFKNDLHDKTPQIKQINSIQVSEVCQHCKSVIEWKIKYKKYKPLKQAKTCVKCNQRNIKKAYHVLCSGCAKNSKSCAKCLKTESQDVEIEPAPPSMIEQMKLKAEMDRMIKTLPERKRRTFLRFMNQGKQKENLEKDDSDTKPVFVPHSKDELIEKFNKINVANDDDDEFYDFLTDDDEDLDEEEEDGDEEEEDSNENISSDEELSRKNKDKH